MTGAPDFASLIVRLETVLAGTLPGVDAQITMAPRPRPDWEPGRFPEGTRDGAGLLLLYPVEAVPWMVLTLRSRDLPTHRGQVSLPGGMVQADETLEEAARREAHEETNVDPRAVRILGTLTPVHIPVSGLVLHPFVGAAGSRPDLHAADGEVERILEVPLAHLLDETRAEEEPRTLAGAPRTIPFYRLGGEKVWGATAMVLAEFRELLVRRD